MKRVAIVLGITFCCALSACNSPEVEKASKADKDGIDSNLECAAMISAANALVVSGEAENDPAFAKRALVSSMTYLNAYAIPKGKKEAEAFDELKSHRAALLDSRSAFEIMSRAKQCVDLSPL